jgi:hypothetical protein
MGERGSRRSQGGLTVIYVAVGSLASCLIKVVSPDRGRAAKLLTRKFSRQSPRLPPHSALVFIPFPTVRVTLRQTSACSNGEPELSESPGYIRDMSARINELTDNHVSGEKIEVER